MTQPGKTKTLFRCRQCGFESRKWLGRCPDCGAWDSLVESAATPPAARRHTGAEAQALVNGGGPAPEDSQRLVTGIAELDRVLGGGIVPGSLVLIGGDPGIGKSTLLLQFMTGVAAAYGQVLYVTGEESLSQIRMRAGRLGLAESGIAVSTETCVEAIVELAAKMRPVLLAVDSIQTVSSEEVASTPGSITQVRESAARLLALAKRENIPVFLVGHVTKDGSLAGPRVLEHMVDTVLYFEGDRGQMFRLLRTVKNRFGSTNEIGVFTMREQGLAEVANPSALFLAERPEGAAGSVVLPSMEGTRPIMVEVQALVSRSNGGSGRRTAIGVDAQRLALLTAVLEKKQGINLIDHDIFLNIAGGIRIDEPALDLGVAAALLSSYLERPIDAHTVVCGEIGLAGEVRAVGQMEQRLKEAARLGFTRFLLPVAAWRQVQEQKKRVRGMALVAIANVGELAEALFAAEQYKQIEK
ncbi:DNA repair protein RadA [Desulfobulbus oralis]|uniref:DNA repair protein RadA n=1 Tax=Desulfobulbus oralis TaxID=1986146 RepID=A0A2L1GRJ1_9BACT|nr:DNA repair protein RadA [Desulfobulbus oralis]